MKPTFKIIIVALAAAIALIAFVYSSDQSAVVKQGPASLLGGAGSALGKIGASYYESGDYSSSSEDSSSGFSFILAAVLGLIPASIAKNKGRSFGAWWFYGWMLFIVALIHSIVMKSNNPEHVTEVD